MVPHKNFSILLVTFNRIDFLDKLLASIQSYNWPYNQFVIVDNNSSDGTREFLSDNANLINLKVIFLDKNIGHGAALGVGMIELKKLDNTGEFILFLEDDSLPLPKLPELLINWASKTNFDFISSGGSKVALGKRLPVRPQEGQILEADFCLFDGAIIKRSVIEKIGIPQQDWFMMFDDFEYCYRMKRAGFKLGVIQNNLHTIMHLGGGTRFSRNTLWRGYYQSRNHVLFLKTYFNGFNLFDFILLEGKRLIGCFAAPDRFQRISMRIKGVFHGIIGRRGKTLDPGTLKFLS